MGYFTYSRKETRKIIKFHIEAQLKRKAKHGKVTGAGWRFAVLLTSRVLIFILGVVFTPDVRPTKPPAQWETRDLPSGVYRSDHEAGTQLCLVQSLKILRDLRLFLHSSSWSSA
jgi:hypothetical protein